MKNIILSIIALILALIVVVISSSCGEEIPVETHELHTAGYVIQKNVVIKATPMDVMTITEEYMEPKLISLGKFRVTAYCACSKCCGHNTGITASGTIATAERTIAVDPGQIPYGSVLVINGQEYVAEDCGSGIGENCIDIFFDSHEEALKFGCQYIEVFTK